MPRRKGDIDKLYALASDAERCGDLSRAHILYKQAADKGHILAHVGMRRIEKRQNTDSSDEQLEKNAKDGDARSAYMLGKRLVLRREYQFALRWLEYARQLGYDNATSMIAHVETTYKVTWDGQWPRGTEFDAWPFAWKPDADEPVPDEITSGEQVPDESAPDEPAPKQKQEVGTNKAHTILLQQPNARFKLWLSPDFKKEVDKAFGTRQAFLWRKFDAYIEDLDAFDAELQNNSTVQMFTLRFETDEIAIKKFRIDDASRVFFTQMDESLAERLDVVSANDEISPAAGDYCFIGVTRSGEHERQNPYASTVGKRFLKKHAVELYAPESQVLVEEEDQNDRTRRLNVAVASYALNLPFASYQDYCDYLPNPDIKLSEEQFGILENIVQDYTKRLILLMGCAGSGKTLMAVTLLLCKKYGGHGNRLYFALSDRLAASSETSFCKIAVCKAVEDCSDKERPSFERLKSEVVSSLGKLKVADLEGYAVRCGVDVQSAKKAFQDVRPEFNNANRFLMELTGLKAEAFVTYERFRVWLNDKYGVDLPNGLNVDDVWTEIRGLIKGYLGSRSCDPDRSWYWGNTVYHMIGDVFNDADEKPNRKVIEEIQASLKRNRVVEAPHGACKDFVFVNLSKDAEYKVIKDCSRHSEWVRKLFAIVRAPDYSKRGLGINEYMGLRNEESVYPKERREQIYRYFEDYDAWLRANDLFDENDLARKTIYEGALNHLRLEPPAVLVVDECQDFTEMQLLALYQLSGDMTRVIFAGDRHQIINPTYFNPERIKKMPGIGAFDPHFIKDNHRSSREIVRISNVVSAKRRRTIGSYGKKYEQDEKSDTEGFYPHFLCYGNDVRNFAEGLKRVIEDPQTAIIVHSEEDKSRLRSILPRDKKNQLDVVTYTIKECKGLEFKKVFCFDILSKYAHEWNQILSGNVRHGQNYRYYFNTLYVSITRSQNGICLLEDDGALKLHGEWLVKEGGFREDTPANFNALRMEFDLKVGSAREWLHRAQEDLEKADGSDDVELFKHVRLGFTEAMGRADADDNVKAEALKGQAICDVNILKLQNHLREAMQMCIDHQLIDLLPEAVPDNEALQHDLEIVKSIANVGFMNVAKEDIPKAVALFSRSNKAKEFLELGESMQMEHVIALANEMANEIRMT